MCPFCYIGKRKFEAAMATLDYKDKIEVEWKSFLLNPDLETDPSKSTIEYLADVKNMSVDQAKADDRSSGPDGGSFRTSF